MSSVKRKQKEDAKSSLNECSLEQGFMGDSIDFKTAELYKASALRSTKKVTGYVMQPQISS